MNELLATLWGIRTLRSLLAHVSLWQVKEYRLDRLRAHFTLPSTVQGLFHPVATVKWGAVFWLLADAPFAASPIMWRALTAAYTLETVAFARELFRMRFRRPRPTGRVLVICAFVTFLLVLLLLSGVATRSQIPPTLLVLDRLLPFLVAAAVAATVPLVNLERFTTIRRATRKLQNHRGVTTVGVTGSFGKSSAKEFLFTMLRDRFDVLKTPANVNTEIGIARTVLASLRPIHDVFVCEMGAYRPGEIARVARIVRPRIGILTAVRNQHLALFGSHEAIAETKAELLRALPADGTAIVNGDDPTSTRLAKGLKVRRVLRYGRGADTDVRVTRTEVRARVLTITVAHNGETADVIVPLLGQQHTGSLLAATAAALVLGLTLQEIAEAAAAITSLPRTMEHRLGPSGSSIVDDTYSANPDGVVAAIEFLRFAGKGTTVAVLANMIELGRDAPGAHRRVGEALARARPALVVLTAQDYADEIIRGAVRVDATLPQRMIIETDADRAFERVQPLLNEDTVVLLEGRIPETLRRSLLLRGS